MMDWYGQGQWAGHPTGLGALFGFAFMMLLLVGVAALIYWLVRSATRPDVMPSAPDTRPAPRTADAEALAILDRRFANGEIDGEQYDDMKRRLLG